MVEGFTAMRAVGTFVKDASRCLCLYTGVHGRPDFRIIECFEAFLESSDVCTPHSFPPCCRFDTVTISKGITRLEVVSSPSGRTAERIICIRNTRV